MIAKTARGQENAKEATRRDKHTVSHILALCGANKNAIK